MIQTKPINIFTSHSPNIVKQLEVNLNILLSFYHKQNLINYNQFELFQSSFQFKIKSKGTCAVGVVKYGKVKMSDNLVIFPGAKKTKCKEILVFHDESKVEALPGDNVGVNLSNISVNDLHRGMVIGLEYNNPPKEAKSFQAQIIVLNHPKQVKENSTIIVDCHSGQVECKINILEKFDRKTGEVVKKNPTGIENGEAALVELTPIKPMVVEKFEDYPSLGRISLRDNNEVIAVGIVKSVINK